MRLGAALHAMLLEDVLAPAYASLLQEAARVLGPGDAHRRWAEMLFGRGGHATGMGQ